MDVLHIEFIVALPTVIIGCIAVYIAYQQWHTNHRKLELDLYDRRLRLYQATTKYIFVKCAIIFCFIQGDVVKRADYET